MPWGCGSVSAFPFLLQAVIDLRHKTKKGQDGTAAKDHRNDKSEDPLGSAEENSDTDDHDVGKEGVSALRKVMWHFAKKAAKELDQELE